MANIHLIMDAHEQRCKALGEGNEALAAWWEFRLKALMGVSPGA